MCIRDRHKAVEFDKIPEDFFQPFLRYPATGVGDIEMQETVFAHIKPELDVYKRQE